MASDEPTDGLDQLVMSASAVESATRTARVCTRCVHIKHKFSDGYVNETYPYVGFWERFMLSLETRWRLIKKAHHEETEWYAEDDATGQTRLVTDGGRTDDDLTDRWEEKAEENVEEWGNQRHDTLLLALIEEVGEVAMAMEQHNAPGDGLPPNAVDHDQPEVVGRDLIGEMADLGRRTRDFLEGEYGDPAGDGDSLEEYRVHGESIEVERILEEVEDTAPLCFQLYWALQEVSESDG